MSPRAVIEVEKLSHRFGKFPALQDISFEVQKGEIFGLIGPNGAGKTTLVRSIVTLLKPDSGRINVVGTDVARHHKKVRQLVGYVPAQPLLYPHLTAKENLELFASLYKIPGKVARERIHQFLSAFDVWQWRNKQIKAFSTGMMQKINICRGLLHNPKVLILDEPTNGLDPQSRRVVRDFLFDIKAHGTTIVFTTHLMWAVEEICDRILILDKGKMVQLGRITDLKASIPPQSQSVRVHVDGTITADHLQALQSLDYVSGFWHKENHLFVFELSTAEYFSAFHQECAKQFSSISLFHREIPTLEDVFLYLTEKD